ncbi:HAMP domain-containing sensor histidine kinase [Pelagicoccus sp. SDUM812003]|uniref:sensor histidine kinase n=1 Tax=Pelagicoccus sp. SDUM812003 TaxID=3041267 RepID=UPI00280FA1C4|nr:HAMP domain-containing sensor histidine kinase [Pelagicoccus sp. SDUM812003]MDQ8204738.1 HAMP domain-containing sensor histidine kinase [Pelagicoccus sp. SDUM812003]
MQLGKSKIERPSSRADALHSLLKLVCELTGMNAALIARKTENEWRAYAAHECEQIGISPGDTLRLGQTSFGTNGDSWATVFGESMPRDMLPSHLTERRSERRSYLLVPLFRANGSVTEAICAFDGNAAALEPRIDACLTVVANLVALQLREENTFLTLKTTLTRERANSQSREEFIAVLGHDLRSPLNGIKGATEVIAQSDTTLSHSDMIEVIRDSCTQISCLIEDVLDFARGQLGSGIPLSKGPALDLSLLVAISVSELRVAYPNRQVVLRSVGNLSARVDEVRFRQLLSNLIGNALKHSPLETPVEVKLDSGGNTIRITITNQGPPMSPQTLKELFTPFARGGHSGSKSGLGLGLYIAAEIARAHGGSVEARCDDAGTTFTAYLPNALDS